MAKSFMYPAAPKLPRSLRAADRTFHDLSDGMTIKGVDYGSMLLLRRLAEGLKLEACTFSGSHLTGSHLWWSAFSDLQFIGCDLSSMSIVDGAVSRCRVVASRMTGSSWRGSHLTDVAFKSCLGKDARFDHTTLNATVFESCDLRETDFRSTTLTDVRFVDCDLSEATFKLATMTNVMFDQCTMTNVGGTDFFRGAVVRGQGAADIAMALAQSAGICLELPGATALP